MRIDFEALHQNDNYRQRLENHIWLMDNHKWAICAWEERRLELDVERFALIHADYHWDAVDEYRGERRAQHLLKQADIVALTDIVRTDTLIRLDSFIAPAVRRRMFGDVHFFCRQDDGDRGLDAHLLRSCGARQFFHDNPKSLAACAVGAPYVFDLCLDLFNNSDVWQVGDLWADEDITGFLDLVEPLIRHANAVTVSMSFDYSGAPSDTRHLTQLVLPRLQEWRA